MSKNNEPDTSNIVGVQFSVMSPDEIRNRSVVEVTRHDTYDKDTPVDGELRLYELDEE